MQAQQVVAKYQWSCMGSIYDEFFVSMARGDDIIEVRRHVTIKTGIATNAIDENQQPRHDDNDEQSQAQQHWSFIPITDASDPRVATYRPKSIREHIEYHNQISKLRQQGYSNPTLHGGRRACTRMLEAIAICATSGDSEAASTPGSSCVQPISFLTTTELASQVFIPLHENKSEKDGERLGPIPSLQQVPIYVVERKELLDEIRGQKLNTGDAILAMVQFPVACLSLKDLIVNPPLLILEDVRNAENVGSILRTAFCLGITSIVASATTWAALQDSRSARCSMGTIYYHRFYKTDDSDNNNDNSMASVIGKLREAGIRVYGVEIGPQAKPVGPHGKDHMWAAVMGNEDEGLTEATGKACDNIVFVPQAHGDSLNVGHAAAIAMFELGRYCPAPKHDGRASCA